MGAEGGSEFCTDYQLTDRGNNKFVCLESITGMEAMAEMLNTPEEVKWNNDNGAVIKFTQ